MITLICICRYILSVSQVMRGLLLKVIKQDLCCKDGSRKEINEASEEPVLRIVVNELSLRLFHEYYF